MAFEKRWDCSRSFRMPSLREYRSFMTWKGLEPIPQCVRPSVYEQRHCHVRRYGSDAWTTIHLARRASNQITCFSIEEKSTERADEYRASPGRRRPVEHTKVKFMRWHRQCRYSS